MFFTLLKVAVIALIVDSSELVFLKSFWQFVSTKTATAKTKTG